MPPLDLTTQSMPGQAREELFPKVNPPLVGCLSRVDMIPP